MARQEVVLIDHHNKKIGVEEKLKVHKEGKLHRAFSIFIFNSKGELLIQQRAKEKYPNRTLHQYVYDRLHKLKKKKMIERETLNGRTDVWMIVNEDNLP